MFDIREQEESLAAVKTADENDQGRLRLPLEDSRHDRLTQLMASAFSGQIGRNRDLKYWENLRLKPQHIQMLMMKSAGYRNNEIARQMELTEARVSVIVNHPDAQSVMATLVSFQAEELLDIKSRIQAHSGEALNVALDVLRNAKDDSVRAKTAFSLLDRAGYGAIQRTESKVEIQIPERIASGLRSALEEAALVEDAEYSFVDEPKTALGSGTGEPSNVGVSASDSNEPPVVDCSEQPLFRRTA